MQIMQIFFPPTNEFPKIWTFFNVTSTGPLYSQYKIFVQILGQCWGIFRLDYRKLHFCKMKVSELPKYGEIYMLEHVT